MKFQAIKKLLKGAWRACRRLPGGSRRTLVLLALTFLFVHAGPAKGQEIVIVQTSKFAPYQEAVNAFDQTISAASSYHGVKVLNPVKTRKIDLSQPAGSGQSFLPLNDLKADLIVAVGTKALNAVQQQPAQIVYLMASGVKAIIRNRPNICGIEMVVSPRAQLAAIKAHLPKINTILLLYDPAKTGPLVRLTEAAAPAAGLKIVSRILTSVKDLKKTLADNAAKTDAILLLPDTTVLSPATLKLFTIFSASHKMPLISFSPKYLRHGAAMAVFGAPSAMGEQAGRLALSLLSEEKVLNEELTDIKKYINIFAIARKWAAKIIKDVGIPDPDSILDRYPHELSGGMRQRVMIAIALSCSPKLLIADEPTTALDVTIQAQILYLMKRLQKDFQTSILMITHDLGLISEICDRVAVMYSGYIVEYGSIFKLFKKPLHPYTQGLITAIPRVEKKVENLSIIPGMVPNLIYPPDGCRFHPRCEHCFEPCPTSNPKQLEVEPGYFVACHLYDPTYKDLFPPVLEQQNKIKEEGL